MPIIERSNPLNLSYQICIVSGASSELGTIICKTLLKANAFVYGVDSYPKHDSLNAGMAMHFGFEEGNLVDSGAAEKIIESVRVKHKTDRLDLLVNVVENANQLSGLTNLSTAVGAVMPNEGKGRIINVLGNDSVFNHEVSKVSKSIRQEHKNVDCNVVVSSKGPNNSTGQQGAERYKLADPHMREIKNMKDGAPKHSEDRKRFYEIGNLTLYLASNMSDLNNSLVYIDGSYEAL